MFTHRCRYVSVFLCLSSQLAVSRQTPDLFVTKHLGYLPEERPLTQEDGVTPPKINILGSQSKQDENNIGFFYGLSCSSS